MVFYPIVKMKKFYNFSNNFVEKIIYNPNTRSFTFTKRNMFFATKMNQEVQKSHILFTDDNYLNKIEKINYINMDNLETYSIQGAKNWNHFNLWCHLIRQNASQDFTKVNKNKDDFENKKS